MYTLQLLFGPVGPEILIIVALLVLLFGADRIPTVANSVGKSLGTVTNEKKKVEAELNEAKQDLSEPIEETKEEFNEAQQDLSEPIEETKEEFNEIQEDMTEPTQEAEDEPDDAAEQMDPTPNKNSN